jgi:hypothetical protein
MLRELLVLVKQAELARLALVVFIGLREADTSKRANRVDSGI